MVFFDCYFYIFNVIYFKKFYSNNLNKLAEIRDNIFETSLKVPIIFDNKVIRRIRVFTNKSTKLDILVKKAFNSFSYSFNVLI